MIDNTLNTTMLPSVYGLKHSIELKIREIVGMGLIEAVAVKNNIRHIRNLRDILRNRTIVEDI